jgi:hypothetical protein
VRYNQHVKRSAQVVISAAVVAGCGPETKGTEADEQACPAQPRICELFTFVRQDDGLALRQHYPDEDVPAPPEVVYCVLEAIRDGTPSIHSLSDGWPTERYGDTDGIGSLSRDKLVREVRVFEDGHVEIIDSHTENFPDPTVPEPRGAHFSIRPRDYFDQCLASTDAEVLRDCLWGFEAEEVPESGCRPPQGAPAGGGGGSGPQPSETTGG